MPRIPFFILLTAFATSGASALSLGPDEFASAERLTCVLAQQSLGYLSEEEYTDKTGQLLEDYGQDQSDVIYAKALGYFHGLMFGLDERSESELISRTQVFLNSQACLVNTGVGYGLFL